DTTKRRRPVRGGPSSPARQPRPPGARTRERRRVMAREGSEARTPAAEVDLGRLAEISGGDTEFEQQLAGEYVNQAADLLEEMAQAAQGRDAETVRRTAHTLKGSSRTIGALSMALQAAQIEQLAAAGDPSATAARLVRARACLAATQ